MRPFADLISLRCVVRLRVFLNAILRWRTQENEDRHAQKLNIPVSGVPCEVSELT